jgi:hypothetical protein
MQNKRKNPGNIIIFFGCLFLMSFLLKLDGSKITTNHIVILVCNGIFICCGIYVNIRSRKKV